MEPIYVYIPEKDTRKEDFDILDVATWATDVGAYTKTEERARELVTGEDKYPHVIFKLSVERLPNKKEIKLNLEEAKDILRRSEGVEHDQCGLRCPGAGPLCSPYLNPLRDAIKEAERETSQKTTR